MPVATPHHPDGSPVCHPGAWKHQPGTPGEPLVYDRRTEERAVLSAKKAWWHPKSLDPAKSEPPVGALIHMDGEPFLRFERVPVFGPDGETVVGTRLDWVDLRAQRRAEEEAKALEEARAQVKAKRGSK